MSVNSLLIDPYRNHIGFGRLRIHFIYRIHQRRHVNGRPMRYEIARYSSECDIL